MVAYFPEDTLRHFLLRFDLRLRQVVDASRDDMARRAADPFRGLVVTDEDVEALLADTPNGAETQLPTQENGDGPWRLQALAELFELDTFSLDALLVCVAPELDLRYERLYGYLQDDVTRKRPTVDLILRLLRPAGDITIADREALGPAGPLLSSGLATLADPAAAAWPLLARPLRPDERITSFLLGSDDTDGRIASFAELCDPAGAPAAAGLPPDLVGGLSRLLSNQLTPIVYLNGGSAANRRAVVRAACAAAELPLLRIGLRALLESDPNAAGLPLARREAQLQRAVLCLDEMDELIRDQAERAQARTAVRELLARPPLPVVMLGDAHWEPSILVPGLAALRLEMPRIGTEARVQVWHDRLDGQLNGEERLAVQALSEQYRLDEEGVRAAVGGAQLQAAWRGMSAISSDDLRTAARAIAAPPLEGLAKRVSPRYGWDDIVLTADASAQLREICGRLHHQVTVLEGWGFGRKHARRMGATALFAGQPGTGKTMAAEILAGEMGLELYRIDLSAVVSKYIGETEKNLERIFQIAEQGDAVLLFDEADALFGKRSEVKDAHDRYANVEIAFLLQRLESYDGLGILTTNLRGNLDEAFVRRLDFAIEFPMPDEPERLQIWTRALPPEAPLGPDVDLPFLARKFKLAGGHIRNIALGAGFLAAADEGAIEMKHLVRATRREYQKIGKLIAEADFEQYFGLLKEG